MKQNVFFLKIVIFSWFLLTASTAQAATVSVAVVDLHFKGEISPALKDLLSVRLMKGLAATGLELIKDEAVQQVLKSNSIRRCNTPDCWRTVAGKLACRYIVGATVEGEDRLYDLHLWIADGYTGRVAAEVDQRCEICGLNDIADKMELSASALRAKLESLSHAPAPVTILTEPTGATVAIDGDPVGPSPRAIELPPGEHRITVSAEGYIAATRTINAIAGVQDKIEIRLIPVEKKSYRRPIGWIGVGVGVASLIAGAVLFTINGEEGDCQGENPLRTCAQHRDTSVAAWTMTGIGLGAALGGTYLLCTSKEKAPVIKQRTLSWLLSPVSWGFKMSY